MSSESIYEEKLYHVERETYGTLMQIWKSDIIFVFKRK